VTAIARWALRKTPRFLIEEVSRQVARLRGTSALDVILGHLIALLDPQPVMSEPAAEVDSLPMAAGGGL
jgi:hypothetical protein